MSCLCCGFERTRQGTLADSLRLSNTHGTTRHDTTRYVPEQEAYDARLTSTKLGSSERAQVLAAYLKRASFLKRHGSSSIDGSGSGITGAGAPTDMGGGSFVSPARRGPTSPRKASGL